MIAETITSPMTRLGFPRIAENRSRRWTGTGGAKAGSAAPASCVLLPTVANARINERVSEVDQQHCQSHGENQDVDDALNEEVVGVFDGVPENVSHARITENNFDQD